MPLGHYVRVHELDFGGRTLRATSSRAFLALCIWQYRIAMGEPAVTRTIIEASRVLQLHCNA